MLRSIARAVAVVVGVVLTGAVSVVVVDAWRAADVRPPDCSSVLLVEGRGDQRADVRLQAAAWSVVSRQNSRATGDLDGRPPLLDRSCLLYAGSTGSGTPSVVFAEATFSAHTGLFRLIEVRGNERAATGYPVLIGSETAGGLMLPLSGTYLAPPDVIGVTVVGVPGRPAAEVPQVAPGVFAVGVAPDLTRAPNDRFDDVPAGLLVRRLDGAAPELVALPVVANDGGIPLRVPVRMTIDGHRTADEATLRIVEQVLPLLLSDQRLPAVLRQAPPWPSLAVRTAVVPGGRSVVVGSGRPGTNPGLPIFDYVVRGSGEVTASA